MGAAFAAAVPEQNGVFKPVAERQHTPETQAARLARTDGKEVLVEAHRGKKEAENHFHFHQGLIEVAQTYILQQSQNDGGETHHIGGDLGKTQLLFFSSLRPQERHIIFFEPHRCVTIEYT